MKHATEGKFAPAQAPVTPRFQGAVRPNYFYAITNEDADAALELMRTKPYAQHGYAVRGPSYIEGVMPCYVQMSVPNDPTHRPVMMHGLVLEHVLKRDDIAPELRKELKEALQFFTCLSSAPCWGEAKHPYNRGQTPA